MHQASQLNKSVATTALTMTNVFAMMCQTRSRSEGDSPLHGYPYAKISCPKLNPKAFPDILDNVTCRSPCNRLFQTKTRTGVSQGNWYIRITEVKSGILILNKSVQRGNLKIQNLFCISDIIFFKNKKLDCRVAEVNVVSATPCKCSQGSLV